MTDLVVVIVSKAPLLSLAKVEKLSDICADIALVSLGSVVLPAVLDKPNLNLILFGVAACSIFWGLSVWLVGKGELS